MDHLPRHEHRNLSPKATSGMDRMIAPFLSAKICSSSSFSGRIKVPFSYNADARPLDKKPTFQQESVRNWPPWGAKSVRVLRAEASGPSSKIFAPATLRALRPLFGLSCACSKAAAAQKRKSAATSTFCTYYSIRASDYTHQIVPIHSNFLWYPINQRRSTTHNRQLLCIVCQLFRY